jgi:hypothetical protein
LRKSTTWGLHERLTGARSVVVNHASDLTLAGSRFPREQHGDVERSQEPDLVQDGGQRRAAADEAVHSQGLA